MKRPLILLIIVVAFVTSCGGKKEVKRVSEDSKIATEAFALADTLKNAYLSKDRATIERNATSEGYRTVLSTLKNFDSAELDFNPVWVEIEGDTVHLNISWKGKWQKAGKVTEERGMGVFVLKGRPMRLDNILRANPFAHPD